MRFETLQQSKIDRLSAELVATKAKLKAAQESENRVRGSRDFWMQEAARLGVERDNAALDANLALSLLEFHGYVGVPS